MKLFIWDFHGVLETGNDNAVLEITNTVLERQGYVKRMTVAESTQLSGLPWHQYFPFLLPEVDRDECLKLQDMCFDISQNQPEIVLKHVKINAHAQEVVDAIHTSHHTQILISNTLPKALDRYVNVVGLESYFPATHRFGVDVHHQKGTKKSCLQKFMQGKEKYHSLISIGDSPGDMALIDEQLHGIGYLYSHPSKQHRVSKCHHKIDDLRVVLQEL